MKEFLFTERKQHILWTSVPLCGHFLLPTCIVTVWLSSSDSLSLSLSSHKTRSLSLSLSSLSSPTLTLERNVDSFEVTLSCTVIRLILSIFFPFLLSLLCPMNLSNYSSTFRVSSAPSLRMFSSQQCTSFKAWTCFFLFSTLDYGSHWHFAVATSAQCNSSPVFRLQRAGRKILW